MSTQYKPITAITMGDPAGIGPEIVVGTMLSEEIHDCCRPFVIGSIAIMERAAKVLGKELKYNKIEDPSEAKYEFGTVDIIETGDYDTDSIEWGKVQALAGRMAVDWIMKSIELGQAGKIDAVSTAPIHKGAIKLIGVKEPGHTEIYQNATHSPYALTMFSCHKLRVFFVSRLVGLISAATAVIFFFVINLLLPKKERNAMGAAIGTTALNSAMTPAAVAEADPSMEGMVSMATAQCATASIITLFLCPFITAAFDKWMQKRQKGIYSPEGWAYDKVKAN